MKHSLRLAKLWVCSVVLAAALAPFTIQAQTIPKLFLIPPVLSGDLGQAETRLLEDKLVSGLLETGAFNVTADLSLRKEESSIETMMEHAKQAGMDFVLFLGLSSEGKAGPNRNYSMSLRLLAVDTGKETFTRVVKFAQSKADTVIPNEAKRVAVAAKAREDVTADMVDALIKVKDWEAAGRYLNVLEQAKPNMASSLAARRSIINKNMAALRYGQSREAVSLRLYEEARAAIADAKSLDPESNEYSSYSRVIDDEQTAYMQQSDEAKIREIEDYLERNRLDVAAALFERSGEGTRFSAKGKILSAKIQRGQDARRAALQAEALFADEYYAEALSLIDEALQLHPDQVSYIRLRTRILEAERRRAAVNERWAAYKEEFEAFNLASLAIARRSPPYGWSFSLGVLNIERLDPSAGTWLTEERGGYPAFNLGYSYALPYSYPGPFSFNQIASGAWAEGGIGGGVSRRESRLQGAALVAESNTAFWLAGGLEARAEVLSFALIGRLGLDLSVLSTSWEHLGSNGNIIVSDDQTCTTAAFVTGLELAWVPSTRWSLAFFWRASWPFASSLPLNDGAPTRSNLGLALRFGML
ncbi:hypothetical protein MASR2M78_14770 [Treponema sp.]